MVKVKIEELANEWKCAILMKEIFKMIEGAQLPGCDIIASLNTVMCNVIYHTCSERSQKLFERTAETIKKSILDGLKEIEKLEKEAENEQR